MTYPTRRKKFILFEATLTPNYPVGGGKILFAVNKKYADNIPEAEILRVARELGFTNIELELLEFNQLGTMLGFTSKETIAIKTDLGDVTLHILSINTGEY